MFTIYLICHPDFPYCNFAIFGLFCTCDIYCIIVCPGRGPCLVFPAAPSTLSPVPISCPLPHQSCFPALDPRSSQLPAQASALGSQLPAQVVQGPQKCIYLYFNLNFILDDKITKMETEARQHVLHNGLNSGLTNKAKYAALECVATAENKVGQNDRTVADLKEIWRLIPHTFN